MSIEGEVELRKALTEVVRERDEAREAARYFYRRGIDFVDGARAHDYARSLSWLKKKPDEPADPHE